jgi:hypothetical protein
MNNLLWVLLMVGVLVALIVAGMIALSLVGAPNEYAIALAGIGTTLVVALFKYWPFDRR